MFVTFVQNNSGGYYMQNEDVDTYVIIEGSSLEEILNKADSVFKHYREYCPCCGERWDDYRKDESYLDESPMIYGESVYDFHGFGRAIIYRVDGTKEVVDFH